VGKKYASNVWLGREAIKWLVNVSQKQSEGYSSAVFHKFCDQEKLYVAEFKTNSKGLFMQLFEFR